MGDEVGDEGEGDTDEMGDKGEGSADEMRGARATWRLILVETDFWFQTH